MAMGVSGTVTRRACVFVCSFAFPFSFFNYYLVKFLGRRPGSVFTL